MELSKEQRKQVLSLIKEEIKRSGNCRVGWALKQAIEPKYEKSIHNKEKIANSIIGLKYSKEKSQQAENDFNIYVSPKYRYLMFGIAIGIITIILSLISTFI